MSCAATSQDEAYRQSNQERLTDAMYQVLTSRAENNLRGKLVNGLRAFILSKVSHPSVDDMFRHVDGCAAVQKAIVLAAIAREPDFLQHLMEREDMCSSSLSQYAVDVLPPLITDVLDGKMTIDDFVLKATHEYIIL